MKTLFISPVSATFELENNDAYFAPKPFNVYINGKEVITNNKTNCFSVYDLNPDTEYQINVNEKTYNFKTKPVSEIVTTKGICNNGEVNVTEELQKLIDSCKKGSLLVFEEGTYFITSLKFKSDLTIYLKKGATILGNTNPKDYDFIPANEFVDGEFKERGIWEGVASPMMLSIINFFDCKNTFLVGEGTINGQAQFGPWWIDVKNKPYVRPHLIFINNSENIVLEGINVKNSPSWTIHPYFVKNLGIYDIYIENPKDSPNTDGIDPQFVVNCDIIGVHFSVGDDCIAVKSGKLDLGRKYNQKSEHITIRNCWMQYGHGGVVLGSEISRGLSDLKCDRCFFDHTDRGLRIKVRRGRGDICQIDNIFFDNIKMDGVLTPITMNMFYFCDPDGKTEYVYTKEKLPVDSRTPYLGKFTFSNIHATNCEYAAGYFYGLPEKFIKEVNIIDSSFEFNKDAKCGKPVMMSFAEECSKKGFVCYNVDTLNLKNVTLKGNVGERVELHEVKKVKDE